MALRGGVISYHALLVGLEVESKWLRKGYYLSGENCKGVLPNKNAIIQRRG